MIRILLPKLSYELTGLCFKIHRELGRFCREKQYADALEEVLKQKQIPYKREFELNSTEIKGNKADFFIDGKVIVDLKAKRFITKEDYNQTQRYLQSANVELGLIINFRSSYLKPKRVLNTRIYSDNQHSGVPAGPADA